MRVPKAGKLCYFKSVLGLVSGLHMPFSWIWRGIKPAAWVTSRAFFRPEALSLCYCFSDGVFFFVLKVKPVELSTLVYVQQFAPSTQPRLSGCDCSSTRIFMVSRSERKINSGESIRLYEAVTSCNLTFSFSS